MVAANLAALYAAGHLGSRLRSCTVAAFDFDLDAPGLVHYDFCARLTTLTARQHHYKFRGSAVTSHEDLIAQIQSVGLGPWITAVGGDPTIQKITTAQVRAIRSSKRPEELRASSEAYVEELATFYATATRDSLKSPVYPQSHLIEIVTDSGEAVMYLFPAGAAPSTKSDAEGEFSWVTFLNDQLGLLQLQSLFRYVSSVASSDRPLRILLDHDAGLSTINRSNRGFAHQFVLVSGFNEQNRTGLKTALQTLDSDDRSSLSRTKIVLSQYRGRGELSSPAEVPVPDEFWQSAATSFDEDLFARSESSRKDITALCFGMGISKESIFVVDFFTRAIQKEFFYPKASASFDEICSLAVSLERKDVPKPFRYSGSADQKQVRVLGEFVGTGNRTPSGPLGALVEWLNLTGLAVSAVASSHEAIAKWVQAAPRAGGVTDLKAGFTICDDLSNFSLSDFDLVALPVHLMPWVKARIERLTPTDSLVEARDCLRTVNERYLAERIIGWNEYAYVLGMNGPELLGFPLFVDHQLIAANKDKISADEFARYYFENEQRRFHGFLDPADVLSVARAARSDDVPNDRLLMTLQRGDIAQWYEWQTVVCLFGALFDVLRDREGNVWREITVEDLSSAIMTTSTIRATRFYLQLCRYADRHSQGVDWTQSLKTFFQDQSVGMIFLWPDAIPKEYLIEQQRKYRFAAPPSQDIIEECWLITVPAARNHRSEAPPTHLLCELLTALMSEAGQRLYQSFGGLAVHRSVQNSVELWEQFPYLPYLSKVRDRTALLRHAPRSSWPLAKLLTAKLETLRDWIGVQSANWINTGRHGYDESFWYDADTIAQIESQIKMEFSEFLSHATRILNGQGHI